MTEWSFFTNHARVLICIVREPGMRLRDIAAALNITERSAYAIVTELAEAGYVVKEKDGRRNRYEIQLHMPLRGALGVERTIGQLLDLVVEASGRVVADPRAHATIASLPALGRSWWQPWSAQPQS